MPNKLIPPISEKTTIPKARFVKLFNTVFDEVNEINTLYEKFFEPNSDKPALATEIENKIDSINKRYSELFSTPSDASSSKIEEINNKIEEIRELHKELISGDTPVQGLIQQAETEIVGFYEKLFTSDVKKNDGGQEKKLNAAIKSIVDFDDQLNKADIGYRYKIERAKEDILSAHSEFFTADQKNKLSKADILRDQIEKTNEFHGRLVDEIEPFIDTSKTEISDIAKDIKIKQNEVDSLLSDTTIQTLSENYKEAMHVYGSPVYKQITKNKWWLIFQNLFIGIKHLIKFVGSYILFIGPLVLIGWFFVGGTLNDVFLPEAPGDESDDGIKFSGTEYIVYKLTIALPLLWVSYFGQKSISQRRRLFEEYNHKYRVLQMYMLFTGKESTYPLEGETRKQLEKALLKVISNNPSDVYGKDETLIDKLIGIFKKRENSIRLDEGSSSSVSPQAVVSELSTPQSKK